MIVESVADAECHGVFITGKRGDRRRRIGSQTANVMAHPEVHTSRISIPAMFMRLC